MKVYWPAAGSSLKNWGVKKWPIWTRRLKEIMLEYEASGNADLTAMTSEAYEKLVSFSVKPEYLSEQQIQDSIMKPYVKYSITPLCF